MSLWTSIEALFWALSHSLWQGLVLHALVLQIRPLTRSPHQRYALLLGAQATLLGLAIATFCYACLHLVTAKSLPVHSLGESTAPLLLGAARSKPLTLELLGADPHFWMSAVVTLWLFGLAVAATRGAGGWAQLRKIRHQAKPLLQWQARVNEYAVRLKLPFAVIVAESRLVTTPLVLGWLKPLILFPCGWASSMAPGVIEAAIIHELIHIRRWDFLVNALQIVVESVLYYHPTTHFLSREIREEREACCDDMVSRHWVDPLDYACALLTLEQQRNQARPQPKPKICVAATDGQLMKRIEQITGLKSSRKPQPIPRGISASLVFAALSLSLWAASCSSNKSAFDGNAVSNRSSLKIAWLPPAIQVYHSNIEAAAEEHGVDADLLAVMMLVESKGNAKAESTMGALGLMQMMPSTAQAIAEQRGQTDHSTAKLLDPDYNLDMAAYFIAKQFRNLSEHSESEHNAAERVRLVAIGYNGGGQALAQYLDGRGALYPETEQYQQLVTSLWNDRHKASSEAFSKLNEN